MYADLIQHSSLAQMVSLLASQIFFGLAFTFFNDSLLPLILRRLGRRYSYQETVEILADGTDFPHNFVLLTKAALQIRLLVF
jgi:hypothetical protein